MQNIFKHDYHDVTTKQKDMKKYEKKGKKSEKEKNHSHILSEISISIFFVAALAKNW
jgi:hypothetical protein